MMELLYLTLLAGVAISGFVLGYAVGFRDGASEAAREERQPGEHEGMAGPLPEYLRRQETQDHNGLS
jgi:hypothetical protein